MPRKELSRFLPRTQLNLPVDFKRPYGRKRISGIIKNISLSGAFLGIKDLDILEGERITVMLNVGNRERPLESKVVWKNEFGCGVEFEHQNNRDVQIIDDLLYFIESKRNTTKSVFNTILLKVSEEI